MLVVGLGGVGAYAAEMICRAGVGRMTIVDADIVQPTNINRQLPATHATLGMEKAKVLEARFRDINPEIELTVLPVYLKDDNIPELLDAARYDFIVDAIDTISPKCYLIYHALQRRIKIISSQSQQRVILHKCVLPTFGILIIVVLARPSGSVCKKWG